MWLKGFLDALHSPHFYTPGSQDTASRSAASAYLYGSDDAVPDPRSGAHPDFLLMLAPTRRLGTGRMLTAPRIRDTLHGSWTRRADRRGRPPAGRETASAFEHVQVRPRNTDAWLLAACCR